LSFYSYRKTRYCTNFNRRTELTNFTKWLSTYITDDTN